MIPIGADPDASPIAPAAAGRRAATPHFGRPGCGAATGAGPPPGDGSAPGFKRSSTLSLPYRRAEHRTSRMRPAQSVLIVEDSYLLLEIVASLCETHGIRVIEASTGEAALTVLRERGGAIDWLFTDIHLPGLIDGWTVAHAFRAIHPDRPVVYTSTDTHGRSGVPGSLFLRKPFQMQEVNRLVRMMVEGLGEAGADSRLCAAG